ncbi:MAG: DUF3830 family protein [Planctomycetes bacterium]|nr:DUF3830 family protein [Planctomycetota bacterium]
MSKQFEIVFEASGQVVVADLLEDKAPITCENFWAAIAEPLTDTLNHGGETGPEMWCLVPPPGEELPYENSTVFPEHGEILYYHYRQPPTRDGVMVYDIGIYWDRGQSKLLQGWIPGNLFARINGNEQIMALRREAGRLLAEGSGRVTLRRRFS